MNGSKSSQPISLVLKNYPTHLLIPSIDNLLVFQAINYLGEKKDYFFEFQGQNLNVEVQEELTQSITFNSGETKEFTIKFIPNADGQAKLIMNVFSLSIVKKKITIQVVRNSVLKNKTKKHFQKYKIILNDQFDNFDANQFFVSLSDQDITIKEEQLKVKSSGPDKDQDLKYLAKAHIVKRNIQKALELSLQISNEDEKYHFYYDLIRAYAAIDLPTTMQIVDSLQDEEKRASIIEGITSQISKHDQEKIQEFLSLIKDPAKKQDLLVKIIGRLIKINPPMAFELSHLIPNELIIAKIFINLARRFKKLNNTPEAVKTLTQILNIFQNSPKINLNQGNPQGQVYEFVKDIVHLIAEIDNPNSAYSVIDGIKNENLKKQLLDDLGNILIETKEEMRKVQERNLVFSQYLLFNVLVSNVSEDIKYFSENGGNISLNLLSQDYSFRAMFFSLSRLSFNIFPFMERLFFDLNNQIAFYIYPSSSDNHIKETNALNHSINKFINPNKLAPQIRIYNLDFIPYLGTPTVILSARSEALQSRIERQVKNINIVVDNNIFNDGATSELLNRIYGRLSSSIVNIVLSYELMNDFELLKALMQALI
ncbi:MAG: hypothetical protein JW891_12350 [Candidatus Lokiarchaeota archaeon]|nr:hypothetical protein [Candidatus Lokiarchaeota archaeon]